MVLSPSALAEPTLLQKGVLLGCCLGMAKVFSKTFRKDAIRDEREGISEQCWEAGRVAVGPLGKWSKSPAARLQRELDKLTR
jgi:hypothetical protein